MHDMDLDALEDHINKYSADGVAPYMTQSSVLRLITHARNDLAARIGSEQAEIIESLIDHLETLYSERIQWQEEAEIQTQRIEEQRKTSESVKVIDAQKLMWEELEDAQKRAERWHQSWMSVKAQNEALLAELEELQFRMDGLDK